MAPPRLRDEYQRILVNEIIDTLLAGHHKLRPDLPYPQSHSDMTWAVYALMEMFDIKRRPLYEPSDFEG
jgi:hypothetical protein